MRLVAVVVAVAACGRINFDPRPGCDPRAPFTSIRPLGAINTVDGEGGLRLSDDELTGYYHSNHGVTGYGIFLATRASRDDDFPLGTFTGIGGLFPSLTPDRLTMVFDALDEIRTATRLTEADMFVGTTPLPNINTTGGEGQAMLDATARELYFVRTTPTEEIFVASWPDLVERRVTELDMPGSDRVPVISADGLTIYWSRFVIGTSEIWMARRTSIELPFGRAMKVEELDTPLDDAATWVSSDLCRLYIESDRDSAGSNYDLYVAERVP